MKNSIKSILFSAAIIMFTTSVFAGTKKSIVCTTFPEYDWIMNILGDNTSTFNISLLQNKGTDLHSYQPSIKDIATISMSDMFVYVGGESEEWVEKVIPEAKNKNQIVVNLMDALGERVREEEIVEGMQIEDHEEHEDDNAEHEHIENHHHEDEGETEYDEHIWLSIKNAIELTKVLSEKIQKLDYVNSTVYQKNTEAYIKQLSALDSEYTNMISKSKTNTILFGDRYPFRYLSEDYGLKYYAAFVGCSAETEASFETIIFLAGKVDELDLKNILTIEKGDKKLAKTIVSATKKKNQSILELDSLQSITQKEIKNGKSYLSTMKKNLETLKTALN